MIHAIGTWFSVLAVIVAIVVACPWPGTAQDKAKMESAIQRKNNTAYSNELAGKWVEEQKALEEKNKAQEKAWEEREKAKVKK